MSNLQLFSFFLFCVGLASSQGCGKYCVCSLEQTDCYFTIENGECLGDVSVLETYVLNIHGPLCLSARRMLKKATFHNTVKVLHDDVCGSIPNCR